MQLKCETFRMQSLSNVDVPKFALPNDMSFRVLSRSDFPTYPGGRSVFNLLVPRVVLALDYSKPDGMLVDHSNRL